MTHNGRLRWRERSLYTGGGASLTEPWGLGGHSVIGSLVATLPPGAWGSLIDALRAWCVAQASVQARVTLLDGVLICRALSHHAEALRACLEGVWGLLRPALLGRVACAPRIWHS